MVKPIDSQPCNTHSCFQAEDDVFSVVQNGILLLTKEELTENDNLDGNDLSTITFSFSDIIGGTITPRDNKFEFLPSVVSGKFSGFTYKLKNSKNETTTANVFINISELPEIEQYFFTTNELDTFKNSFVPPSLADIFKTWARFSDWTNYYPSGTTPQGEAAAWTMMSESQFKCTVNSTTLTGFISPKNYTDYIHEATVSSTASDDDMIALILAYKYQDNTNKVLLAAKTGGGIFGSSYGNGEFAIVYYDGSVRTVIDYKNISELSGNWNTLSPSRVYTARSGSLITCKCSNFNSTVYNEESLIQIDINDYPELSWALEASPYGYACLSQNESTFYDVNLLSSNIGLDYLFDYEQNKSYKFINGAWTETGEKIQDIVHYPRTIKSITTGERFRVFEDSIIKSEE